MQIYVANIYVHAIALISWINFSTFKFKMRNTRSKKKISRAATQKSRITRCWTRFRLSAELMHAIHIVDKSLNSFIICGTKNENKRSTFKWKYIKHVQLAFRGVAWSGRRGRWCRANFATKQGEGECKNLKYNEYLL